MCGSNLSYLRSVEDVSMMRGNLLVRATKAAKNKPKRRSLFMMVLWDLEGSEVLGQFFRLYRCLQVDLLLDKVGSVDLNLTCHSNSFSLLESIIVTLSAIIVLNMLKEGLLRGLRRRGKNNRQYIFITHIQGHGQDHRALLQTNP